MPLLDLSEKLLTQIGSWAVSCAAPVGFEWKAFDSNLSLRCILYPVPLLDLSEKLLTQMCSWPVPGTPGGF